MKKEKAPWKDFEGSPIFEEDVIAHPSGESGTVIFLPNNGQQEDCWLVDYGGSLSRLCLQLGEKGQGVVVKTYKRV